MSILGIHHITIVCSNAQRTINFYTSVLGMRLVKKTVNYDDPSTYHLYFGNPRAAPGSLVTFFEWPGADPGHWGIGGTHHYAMQVPDYDGLLKWKRRLNDRGLAVDGPLDRHYFQSIYFNDPDGTILEIATLGPGWAVDEAPDAIGTEFRAPPPEMIVNNRDEERIRAITWPEPVTYVDESMALTGGLHHITAIGASIGRTDEFLGGLLGMRRVKMTSNFDDPTQAHWYWGAGDGQPGTIITYFERDPARVPRMKMGPGQTHHYALAVPDDDTQLEMRERLVQAGLRVTGVKDRIYFKSIYLNDPDGHIVELATIGPGMAVDEDAERLGADLMLPHWLEKDRERIKSRLEPIAVMR
ncbi:MAG: VOC family protein [Chloroflexia bacterium]